MLGRSRDTSPGARSLSHPASLALPRAPSAILAAGAFGQPQGTSPASGPASRIAPPRLDRGLTPSIHERVAKGTLGLELIMRAAAQSKVRDRRLAASGHRLD